MSQEIIDGYRKVVDGLTELDADNSPLAQAKADFDDVLDQMLKMKFPTKDYQIIFDARQRIFNAMADIGEWLGADTGSGLNTLERHWGLQNGDLDY